jgi:hypothetical protein
LIRRKGHPTYGNRFIGNRKDMEVHDLDNEKTGPDKCKIDEIIKAGNVVIFYPDILDQANKEGLKNCKFCIEEIKR